MSMDKNEKKLLVITTSDAMKQVFPMLVEHTNYSPLFADSEESALATYKQNAINLVILDMSMSKFDDNLPERLGDAFSATNTPLLLLVGSDGGRPADRSTPFYHIRTPFRKSHLLSVLKLILR